MRVWGRITNPDGTKSWVEVSTAPNGSNDMVYLTWLAQVLLLNLAESPIYSQYGIPAHPSVVSQIFPYFYITRTQGVFAPLFASLIVTKIPAEFPFYQINVITNDGTVINDQVPIPT